MLSELMRMNQAIKKIGFLTLVFVVLPLSRFSLSLAADVKSAEPRVQKEDPPIKKKAVPETSKTDGFRLSEKATRTIGLTAKPIATAPEFTMPERALVRSLDILAIYRIRNGWYKLVPVEIVRRKESELTVRSHEIKAGTDYVVISGIELLRATEMEAFGGGE